MIRTFIAIDLPDETKVELERDIRRLKVLAPRVKWSHPENLHLTLKFLGDIPENNLEELFRHVAENVAALEPFPLEIRGIGAFPNWRHPRVIWAGCGEGCEEATGLAGAIEEACADLGYERERRAFRAHLTLGRVKFPADAEGLDRAVETIGDRLYGFVDVDEAVVFMSSLRRTGPVYSPMARLKLGRLPANDS